MSLASCSDFLDKQASNEMSEDKTYADWKMFEYFHNDTYNFLLHACRSTSATTMPPEQPTS